MLDTLAVAQEMTAGGIDRDQAEAIANAMRKVAEQGDHVTAETPIPAIPPRTVGAPLPARFREGPGRVDPRGTVP